LSAQQTTIGAALETDLRFASGATACDRLLFSTSAFDFYQAVRLIALLYGDSSKNLETLPVRLRSRMGFDFAGGNVERFVPPTASSPHPSLVVNFLGLAGAHGPLPDAYMPQLLRDESCALRDFLDIFNHRILLLVYRIHAAHHPELTLTEPWNGQCASELFALIGLGRDPDAATRNKIGVPGQTSVPDRALLEFSGLLAHRPRSASGLERLLSEYFRVPAKVRQFAGGWFDLSAEQWTRIGVSTGRNHALGLDTVLGKRAWDEHAGVAIRLGPLDLDTFTGFLPEGAAHRALSDLARLYLNDEFDISLELVLEKDQVPWALLSSSEPDSALRRASLGRLAWLRAPAAEPPARPLRHASTTNLPAGEQ
jgi:type VI secretion system protein ImpH